MPDEAIYGTRGLAFWEHGSLPVLRGSGAGYSVLYPILAGAVLSLGSLAKGYVLLKPVQAVVMSLAAWPVHNATRRFASERYALVAAALTVASPIVLFSGYVMTEVLYYGLAACALFAIARAVEEPSPRRQAIALALIVLALLTRVQAAVLIPVFAGASVVEACFARRRPSLRALWPVWAILAAGVAVVAAAPGVLGAYADTLGQGYALGSAVRLTGEHFAYLVLMTGVAPFAAVALLAWAAARGREPDPKLRALLSVTVTATLFVVLQVGVFSSRYAPHLLGRDLAALQPLFFCVFAIWLARGAPASRLAASIAAVVVLAIVAVTPWGGLVSAAALSDTPGIALSLRRFGGLDPALTATLIAAAMLVLLRFRPRGALLPVAVVALFAVDSVVASNLVTKLASAAQVKLVGSPRDWIERNAHAPATYVYDGDQEIWTVYWEQRFWNPSLGRVVSIEPNVVPGPVDQRVIPLPADGVLPTPDAYVVANSDLTFEGTPVAQQSRGPDEYALTLWRVSRPARLSTIATGVLPNGDILGDAKVTALACAGGQLDLTLLPKATDALEIDLDGRAVLRAHIGGRASWSGSVHVPATHAPRCTFTIRGGALLGSTQIVFAR